MFDRIILCALVALLSINAFADIHESSAMAERYEDVQRCMERALGRKWQERYDIATTINRWGAIEVTANSFDAAPQVIRMIDLRCRRELDLAGQPRP